MGMALLQKPVLATTLAINCVVNEHICSTPPLSARNSTQAVFHTLAEAIRSTAKPTFQEE